MAEHEDFAAWHRIPADDEEWNDHIHSIAIGDTPMEGENP